MRWESSIRQVKVKQPSSKLGTARPSKVGGPVGFEGVATPGDRQLQHREQSGPMSRLRTALPCPRDTSPKSTLTSWGRRGYGSTRPFCYS